VSWRSDGNRLSEGPSNLYLCRGGDRQKRDLTNKSFIVMASLVRCADSGVRRAGGSTKSPQEREGVGGFSEIKDGLMKAGDERNE